MIKPKIKITKNGLYLVSGKIPIAKEISVGDVNHGLTDWVCEEEIAVSNLVPDYNLIGCFSIFKFKM